MRTHDATITIRTAAALAQRAAQALTDGDTAEAQYLLGALQRYTASYEHPALSEATAATVAYSVARTVENLVTPRYSDRWIAAVEASPAASPGDRHIVPSLRRIPEADRADVIGEAHTRSNYLGGRWSDNVAAATEQYLRAQGDGRYPFTARANADRAREDEWRAIARQAMYAATIAGG